MTKAPQRTTPIKNNSHLLNVWKPRTTYRVVMYMASVASKPQPATDGAHYSDDQHKTD